MDRLRYFSVYLYASFHSILIGVSSGVILYIALRINPGIERSDIIAPTWGGVVALMLTTFFGWRWQQMFMRYIYSIEYDEDMVEETQPVQQERAFATTVKVQEVYEEGKHVIFHDLEATEKQLEAFVKPLLTSGEMSLAFNKWCGTKWHPFTDSEYRAFRDSLVAAGYATRNPRNNEMSLTPHGKKMLREYARLHNILPPPPGQPAGYVLPDKRYRSTFAKAEGKTQQDTRVASWLQQKYTETSSDSEEENA